MKPNWTAIGLAVALLGTCIGWAIRTESRMAGLEKTANLAARMDAEEERGRADRAATAAALDKLKESTYLLLVEYNVTERMKKLEVKAAPSASPKVSPSKVRNDAEKWARSQLPNVGQP